jgi:hypothetical protein
VTGYRVCRCGDAFYPDRGSDRLCRRCQLAPTGVSERTAAPPLLDELTLKQAAALSHPDLHSAKRKERATRVTQQLLEALEQARKAA